MKSRGPQSSDAAAGRSAWVRRVVVGGVGTAGATIALAAFAASAFANAANPLADSHGTISPNANGTVTVTVGGTWNWGALSGSSTQSDCTKRYGVGYAVDWWGFGTGGAAIPGLTGDVAVTTGGTPHVVANQPLSPSVTLTPKGSAQSFHASSLLNGFDPNLCASKDAQGFPQGPWQASATYPSEQSVPKLICVNMYDLHGSPGSPQLGDFTSSNGDNSIRTNDFNPAANAGYCFTPTFQHPVSISVAKTNDADQNNSFTKSETANTAGQDVNFKVVITNTSQTAVAVIDGPISDAFPGGPINVCNGNNGNNVIGSELNPGASVTCNFTVANYAPAVNGNDKVNTVTVSAHEKGLAGNSTGPVQSSSTVKAPAGNSNVTVAKTGPSTGDLNGNGTYKIVATNNGNAASTATTFTDTLPDGESFVSATGPGANPVCSAAGLTVTCNLPALDAKGGANDTATYFVTVKYTKTGDLQDCATIAGQPVPSCVTTHVDEPDVSVKKTGPATGDLNGNGTYKIVATNNGGAASTATTFTDTLPDGETYVSSSGPGTCSAAGQVVTCNLPALDAKGGNNTATYFVTVKYTKTGDLQDCATINGQANPSCVTTHVGKPDVSVNKTGPAVGNLNDTGTYKIVATNNGDAASTATTFTDTLPDGETFVSSSGPGNCSAVGQVVTCQLGALDAKGGHDTATYFVTVKYTKPGNLTDCATINGQPVPSCVTTTVQQPKLQVIKTGPATGTLNGNGTYQIVAVNNGDADSTATTFTDTLPAGETFVSSTGPGNCSANGQVITCQLGPLAKNGGSATYTVTVTYTKTGNLTDCATIGGQPVPSCVTTHIPGTPVLTVVKTNDADGDGVFHDTETATNPGDSVTFKVVITNNSTEPIALDTITDAFSATELAECPNLISVVLDSGDSVSCTFTVDNYAPAAGSSLTDTVTVGGHQVPGGTPVTGSDTSTVKTRNPQTPGPDLAIVKNADKDKVKSGDTLTYTLSVSNVGDGPTTGAVTVTDTVPDGLDIVSVSGGTAWTCGFSGQDITCIYNGGVLNPGDTASLITVVTTVNDTAVGSVINTGVVSTPGDTNPLNDRSTVKTPVTKVLPEKIVKPETPEVLPFTGDRTGQMLPVGLMAVMVGLLLVAVARRRRTD